MSTIERVARAIHAQATEIMDGEVPENWDDCGPDHEKAREEWQKLAIAAIRAIREPTEGMNAAGLSVGDYPWDGKKPSRIFTTMIDSILSEEEAKP